MSSEKKIIISIFALLGLILVIVFAVIRPAFSEIKDLSEKIKNEQSNLETLYEKGKTLAQAKKELKEIEEKKSLLDNVFLEEGKELEFITALERIATRHNISQEVNLGDRQDFKDQYKLMIISLSLGGNFQDLIRYFAEIEKLDFYFNLDSLNITVLPGKEEKLNILLEAKTYWRGK